MRNVSNESHTKNRNTHFIFSNAIHEICAIYELLLKIWSSRTGHRWQRNMAHALPMLVN